MSLISALALAATAVVVSLIQDIQVFLSMYSRVVLNNSELYPADVVLTGDDNFDFIIVGAGSAGSVLANRLTEVKNWSVLLIEAGDYPDIMSNTPGVPFLVKSSSADWKRGSVDDGYSSQAHKTKNVHMTAGKMVGGSSGINFEFYVRGNKHDFDGWVEEGNVGWDWDNVTYYYKKSENCRDTTILNSDSGSLHGTDGYLGVTRPDWTEQTQKYFDALEEDGRTILLDTNGFSQIGYSIPQFTIADAIRQSTSVAFIRPIKDRSNLHILTNTKARKVIIDENNRATGVEIKLSDDTIKTVWANKEVILSAGAYASPHILMLSGIGPSKHLKDVGLDVIVDSPHVGQNLEDHPLMFCVIKEKKNISTITENLKIVDNLDYFSSPNIMGHVALNKSQTYPDVQVIMFPQPASGLLTTIFCSHMVGLEDSICATVNKAVADHEHTMMVVTLQHADSRGYILANSSNPDDGILIHTGYFTVKSDLEKFAYAVQDALSMLNTSVMQNMNAELIDMQVPQCADYEFATHDYWKCFILNTASTEWHASSTCRMGPEGSGVVNERLQVYGVESLRVADASVMAHMTSCNINSVAILIGEKGADMIKEDHGINILTNE